MSSAGKVTKRERLIEGDLGSVETIAAMKSLESVPPVADLGSWRTYQGVASECP